MLFFDANNSTQFPDVACRFKLSECSLEPAPQVFVFQCPVPSPNR